MSSGPFSHDAGQFVICFYAGKIDFTHYNAMYEMVYQQPRCQVFSVLGASGKNILTLSFSVDNFGFPRGFRTTK